MIASKLLISYRFALKSFSLRTFSFMSSKRFDLKVTKMHSGAQNYFKNNYYNASSKNHFAKCNYSSGDNNDSSLEATAEQSEFKSMQFLLEKCLDDALSDQSLHQSLLVSNNDIQQFCNAYSMFSHELRERTLIYICCRYGVHHHKVSQACETFLSNKKYDQKSPSSHLQSEERLRYHLQPVYYHLFRLIGRLNNGVKFLTEMRNDAIEYASKSCPSNSHQLRDFSNQLKSILSIWFSVGLLKLTRITWETPADILETIAKCEAVHLVRSWTDLKKRLGPDRRCYAFFHNSMPRVPLLLLHVALTDDITANITEIVDHSVREVPYEMDLLDKTTAMFYSITSTQKGLQGIEFGIHMIRAVVQELRRALPNLSQFSSLSPIPRFNFWLQGQLSRSIKEEIEIFLPHEVAELSAFFNVGSDRALVEHILAVLTHSSWMRDRCTVDVLKAPLLRLCAEYLYDVKSRGNAYDPVANFHLRNGATLWRINWMADPSVKGLNQSLGIMVNYRYFLNEIEENSRRYILKKTIPVSQAVLGLKSRKSSKSSL